MHLLPGLPPVAWATSCYLGYFLLPGLLPASEVDHRCPEEESWTWKPRDKRKPKVISGFLEFIYVTL